MREFLEHFVYALTSTSLILIAVIGFIALIGLV